MTAKRFASFAWPELIRVEDIRATCAEAPSAREQAHRTSSSCFSLPNQPRALQVRQMSRRRRLGHVEHRDKVADAQLACAQQMQDT